MMNKLVVGQKVWVEPNWTYETQSNDLILPAAVSKVGSKYFEIDIDPRHRYFIDTLKVDSEYSQHGWNICLSRNELMNTQVRDRVTRYVILKIQHLRWDNILTTYQLQRIKKIIDEDNTGCI